MLQAQASHPPLQGALWPAACRQGGERPSTYGPGPAPGSRLSSDGLTAWASLSQGAGSGSAQATSSSAGHGTPRPLDTARLRHSLCGPSCLSPCRVTSAQDSPSSSAQQDGSLHGPQRNRQPRSWGSQRPSPISGHHVALEPSTLCSSLLPPSPFPPTDQHPGARTLTELKSGCSGLAWKVPAHACSFKDSGVS